MRMPANRQGTKSGNWSPSLTTPSFRINPKSHADMDGEDGVEKVQRPDTRLVILFGQAHVLCFDFVRREVVAGDEKLGNGTAHEAREDQTEGCTGETNLHGIGDSIVFRDPGCPGDGGAVTTDQRDRTPQETYGGWQVEEGRHRNAGQVLNEHVGNGDDQQDHERFAARQQILEAGVDADGGKEIDQQDVPGSEIELDPHAGRRVHDREQHREQDSAGDGLRDAELAQETNAVIPPLAHEQHDEAQGHRQERLDP